MNLKFSIQSAGDIITNSSTEVYTVWDRERTEKTIKDMVNSILALGQADLCFDDIFTIEIHWKDEDNWKNYNFDSKEEFIKELEENNGWIDRRDKGISNWFVVKTKEEAEKYLDIKKISEIINNINTLFSSDYYDN